MKEKMVIDCHKWCSLSCDNCPMTPEDIKHTGELLAELDEQSDYCTKGDDEK